MEVNAGIIDGKEMLIPHMSARFYQIDIANIPWVVGSTSPGASLLPIVAFSPSVKGNANKCAWKGVLCSWNIRSSLFLTKAEKKALAWWPSICSVCVSKRIKKYLASACVLGCVHIQNPQFLQREKEDQTRIFCQSFINDSVMKRIRLKREASV